MARAAAAQAGVSRPLPSRAAGTSKALVSLETSSRAMLPFLPLCSASASRARAARGRWQRC
jgi:hypothetical protein